jgi:hypothetical protein
LGLLGCHWLMKKRRKDVGPEKKKGVEKAKVEISPTLLSDRGGRRLGIDRRRFTYTLHIPERRIDGERRRIRDRRGELNHSMILKRRKEEEQRAAILRIRDHLESGDLQMMFAEVEEHEGPQRLRNSIERDEG